MFLEIFLGCFASLWAMMSLIMGAMFFSATSENDWRNDLIGMLLALIFMMVTAPLVLSKILFEFLRENERFIKQRELRDMIETKKSQRID